MSDPKTKEEYFERFAANQRVTGMGFEVEMHVPCPFCAEPDFLICRVLLAEKDWAKGGTCIACGRSAKAIFRRGPEGPFHEIVQTGGPEPPAWLTPKMRRVA
jgi:hypothetical protein